MVRGDSREGNAVADASRAHAAVRWLQKAFSLAEQLEDSAGPGITELRVWPTVSHPTVYAARSC